MTLRQFFALTATFAGTCVVAGCLNSPARLHYLGDADLNYYKSRATRIDTVDVKQPQNPDAISTDVPRVIGDRRKDEVVDLPLAEAIRIALSNNRIIRRAAGFTVPDPAGNSILVNPINTPSVYDPAIQESGVLFGGRGVEAALADFDAQFSTSTLWGRDELISNSRGGRFGPGSTIQTDTAAFRSRVQKATAYGGQIGVNHNWDYLFSDAPGRLFPSAYTGVLSADYRQPLWAGSGVEYTRIAGPLNPNFGAITGVSQGVVIARINQDLALVDFEANVRNMLKDVEFSYWDLYQVYREYDVLVRVRNLGLKVWRDEKQRDLEGAGNKSALAQALDFYFGAKAEADLRLGQIYERELALRRLIGLPVNDCRVLRPSDEPTSAEFIADWHTSLADALTRRLELRRQKWNIKSLELQLQAAKSLTNPRFDFVSQYRVNAFGDRLFGEQDNDPVPTSQGLRSAYETLTQGDQTGWNLGFEFSMPIGFRSAHAQVRNIELRLAKARDVLATQELDISHDLAESFQRIALNYQLAKDQFNKRDAAAERARIQTIRIETGAGELGVETNLLLQALQSFGTAEISYYRGLTDYNKALVDFYFRKGLLLEHNNVQIAEDRWDAEAYREALRRAWARSHALPNPLLDTEPTEFARPVFPGDPEASRFGPGVEGAPIPGPEGTAIPAPGGVVPPAPAGGMNDMPEIPESKPLPAKPPESAAPTSRRLGDWNSRHASLNVEPPAEPRGILRTGAASANENPSSAAGRSAMRTFDGWEERPYVRRSEPQRVPTPVPSENPTRTPVQRVQHEHWQGEPIHSTPESEPRSGIRRTTTQRPAASPSPWESEPVSPAQSSAGKATSKVRTFPIPAPDYGELEKAAEPTPEPVAPARPRQQRTLERLVRPLLDDGMPSDTGNYEPVISPE